MTAGPGGDAAIGEALIAAIDARDGLHRAAMDQVYDSKASRAQRDAKGIEPMIPPKANRLELISYDPEGDKQRHKVEPLFNKIKQFRRGATRYEKLKANFRAFVTLALIVIMLR